MEMAASLPLLFAYLSKQLPVGNQLLDPDPPDSHGNLGSSLPSL